MEHNNSWIRLLRFQSGWQRSFAKNHPVITILLQVVTVAVLVIGLRSEGLLHYIALSFCGICGLIIARMLSGAWKMKKNVDRHFERKRRHL
jgi:hypothetical protein